MSIPLQGIPNGRSGASRANKFLLALAIGTLIGALILWVIPTVLVAASARHISVLDRLKAQADARTAIIQLLGGSGLAAGVLYTARTFSLTREQQYTSRFSQAVEQLGHDSVAVRTGAVFSLERLARESLRDSPAIVALLAAYIRGTATWDDNEENPGPSPGSDEFYRIPYLLVRANDVQAALTVLGRLAVPNPTDQVILGGADLRRAYLLGVNFAGFHLGECHLEIVQLSDAILRDAVLDGAHLEGALLYGADLSNASVTGTSWVTARADRRTRFPSEGFDWRGEGIEMDEGI